MDAPEILSNNFVLIAIDIDQTEKDKWLASEYMYM